MRKYYVCATDKFMSGWGKAENKINKVVIECDSYSEAVKMQEKLEKREEMRYININSRKPYYNKESHYTSYVTKADELQSGWYVL